MNINNLPKYDPNLSDKKEYPEIPDGVYTLQLAKIKPMPLNLAGDEGERLIFSIADGQYRDCVVSFVVYTKIGTANLKWKVPSSQNLLANFVDCIDKYMAGDTANLIGEICDATLKSTEDKQSRRWTNITKFIKTDKAKPVKEIEEDIGPDSIPF